MKIENPQNKQFIGDAWHCASCGAHVALEKGDDPQDFLALWTLRLCPAHFEALAKGLRVALKAAGEREAAEKKASERAAEEAKKAAAA